MSKFTKMKDIENRDDVIRFVDSFYIKVRNSNKLGYIFDEIAQTNWEAHLPVMYSFWASILLEERSFSGNPMKVHIDLADNAPMTSVEFSEWIELFTETIDELFAGEIADEAKARASNIARLMLANIQRKQMIKTNENNQ